MSGGPASAARPRVLYVLGYGRSGSTMLGMALGQHPGMVNLGEISVLPTFVPGATYIAPRACGCLETLDQCPYWQGVARRLGSMDTLAAIGAGLTPTMGWRRYAPWLPEPSGDLSRWAAAAEALYRATIAEAGASVAVDTSKGASRAWWLWRSGAVELSFIWLTRRLEDVIRSQVRHGHSALKTAVSWRLAQRQAAQMARHAELAGLAVPRISYERLIQEPQAVLSDILTHVGLPWDQAVLMPLPAHTIGGEHDGKHGGRLTIAPSARTPPPLPLPARVTARLLNSRPTEPVAARETR